MTGCSSKSLGRKWVVALFKKLQAIYGLRWDEQFRTESLHDLAIVEWGLGLYGLTEVELRYGIDRCRIESEWPPSIALFRKLAKSNGRQAYRTPAKKPRPARDKAIALAALSKIKKSLH